MLILFSIDCPGSPNVLPIPDSVTGARRLTAVCPTPDAPGTGVHEHQGKLGSSAVCTGILHPLTTICNTLLLQYFLVISSPEGFSGFCIDRLPLPATTTQPSPEIHCGLVTPLRVKIKIQGK